MKTSLPQYWSASHQKLKRAGRIVISWSFIYPPCTSPFPSLNRLPLAPAPNCYSGGGRRRKGQEKSYLVGAVVVWCGYFLAWWMALSSWVLSLLESSNGGCPFVILPLAHGYTLVPRSFNPFGPLVGAPQFFQAVFIGRVSL